MSDINFLSTPGAGKDEKAASGSKPLDDELALHIPAPLPDVPEQKPNLILPPPKPPAPPSPSILSQKVPTLPPKPAAPKPPAPPSPPPPKPPKPPAPPVPPVPPTPPTPKPEEERGSDTLRVSLITTGAGASMSEIALRRRLKTFALIGALGIVLDGLIFGGLVYYRTVVQQRNTTAEGEVRAVDLKIEDRESTLQPIRDFQGLVRTASVVLENHEHWTQVLKLLEDRALPNAQFGNLSGADTGTLSFEVRASDYTTLAKQVVAFRTDPRVRNVTIGTASADFDENGLLKGARAAMTLSVDPSIFDFPSAEDATASATNAS